MRIKTLGILAVFGAGLMWAVEPVLVKVSYINSTYLHTSVARAVFVTITALAYALLTSRGSLRIRKKDLAPLVYISLAGTILADLLYLYALSRVTVVTAVLIGHLQPLFIVLIGFFILREDKLGLYDYLGIGCMITAGILVSSKTTINLLHIRIGTTDDILVFGATIAWATAGIVARKYLRPLNAGTITFYRFLIASLALLMFFGVRGIPLSLHLVQVLIGVVVGVGYILYYEGLKRIKAAQAAAVELASPFFAAVLGFLVLSEGITQFQCGGMALLFLGVAALSRREKRAS